MSVWWGVKFFPGGNSTFFGFLNTFVHIIMYSYYLVAALGPQYKKYLWWKKYLTLLQMVSEVMIYLLQATCITFVYIVFIIQVQFTLVGIHAAQLLFIECDYPKVFVYLIFSHALMFLYLFSKFYDRSYKRDDKKPAVNGVDVSEKKSVSKLIVIATHRHFLRAPMLMTLSKVCVVGCQSGANCLMR